MCSSSSDVHTVAPSAVISMCSQWSKVPSFHTRIETETEVWGGSENVLLTGSASP